MPKMEVVELDDDLDDRFRKAIMQSKGLRKGVIKEAFEEAIHVWLDPEARGLVEKYRTKEGMKKGRGKK
jgi:hypothetical protein